MYSEESKYFSGKKKGSLAEEVYISLSKMKSYFILMTRVIKCWSEMLSDLSDCNSELLYLGTTMKAHKGLGTFLVPPLGHHKSLQQTLRRWQWWKLWSHGKHLTCSRKTSASRKSVPGKGHVDYRLNWPSQGVLRTVSKSLWRSGSENCKCFLKICSKRGWSCFSKKKM